MTNTPDPRPTPVGVYDQPLPERLSNAEKIALGLSVVWLLGAGLFFVVMRGSSARSEEIGRAHV